MTVRNIPISDIEPRKRCRKDLGDLESLASSIKEVGLLHAIVVDESYRLIAGERRLRAWKQYKLGDKIPANVVTKLDDAIKLLAAERDENVCRKDFTPLEAVELGKRLEKLERPKAEKRRKETQGRPSKTGGKLPPVSEEPKTRDKVGQSVGMSGKTYDKAKAVVDSGDEEVIAIMEDSGKVDRAFRELKKKEQHAKLDEIASRETKSPTGKFDVIVIDPPWKMEKIERDVAPNQHSFDYPTMSQLELLSLDIPCASDCHVWLWTTHRFLPDALELLQSWKLKYTCTFVWHKPGGFQPFGLPQYNCEFAIYARKGKPTFKSTKSLPVCFNAPRGRHSEKPSEFYDMIRRVTSGRRLDMFNRREIDGFTGWGNESLDSRESIS